MVRAEGMLMASATLRGEVTSPESMPFCTADATTPAPTRIPSHAEEQVLRYMRGLREWAGVDWNEVYDDLDAVLHGDEEISHHAVGSPDGPLRPVHGDELAQRLRAALKLLVARALRDMADRRHPDIAGLIELARTLRSKELPSDPRHATGHVRGLARITLDLAERLNNVGTVTGLVEC
ncbi:DUF6415 family natural product biosynthesis protein [Streptomyces sp. NPDC004042]|uniref:DUF6415 family natural product biosynthesis protein n=1 Tax=Streptomyces sp. NPDC004042 TaxID=3154451 RepID=UPI0033A4ABDB